MSKVTIILFLVIIASSCAEETIRTPEQPSLESRCMSFCDVKDQKFWGLSDDKAGNSLSQTCICSIHHDLNFQNRRHN